MTYTYPNPDRYHGDIWYTENDKRYVVSKIQKYEYVGIKEPSLAFLLLPLGAKET